MINQAGSGRFAITASNCYNLPFCISKPKFYFRNNWDPACYDFLDDLSFIRNSRAFDNFISIENDFFSVMTFFKGNQIFYQLLFIFFKLLLLLVPIELLDYGSGKILAIYPKYLVDIKIQFTV